MNTAEEHIIEKWGENWLENEWTPGAVMTAMEDYATEQTAKYRELVDAQIELYEAMCDILNELQIDPAYYTQETLYSKVKQLKSELK